MPARARPCSAASCTCCAAATSGATTPRSNCADRATSAVAAERLLARRRLLEPAAHELAVQFGDHAHGDVLRADRFALVLVGAVAEALAVHRGDEVARAAFAFDADLR